MIEVHQAASPDTQQMLAALRGAVRKCLERKQRLDQYAVVWRDGKPQRLLLNPTQAARLEHASDKTQPYEIEHKTRELGSE